VPDVCFVRLQKREYDAALDELDRVDPQRTFPPALATRGYILGATGNKAEGRQMLDALATRFPGRSIAFDRAIIHLGLGEKERALDLLGEAIEMRDWRVRLLKEEPIFDSLRSEPRFAVLLARAGFTE
jgi:hypothetical protein